MPIFIEKKYYLTEPSSANTLLYLYKWQKKNFPKKQQILVTSKLILMMCSASCVEKNKLNINSKPYLATIILSRDIILPNVKNVVLRKLAFIT